MGAPDLRPVNYFLNFSRRFPLALEESPDFAAIVKVFLPPFDGPIYLKELALSSVSMAIKPSLCS